MLVWVYVDGIGGSTVRTLIKIILLPRIPCVALCVGVHLCFFSADRSRNTSILPVGMLFVGCLTRRDKDSDSELGKATWQERCLCTLDLGPWITSWRGNKSLATLATLALGTPPTRDLRDPLHTRHASCQEYIRLRDGREADQLLVCGIGWGVDLRARWCCSAIDSVGIISGGNYAVRGLKCSGLNWALELDSDYV